MPECYQSSQRFIGQSGNHSSLLYTHPATHTNNRCGRFRSISEGGVCLFPHSEKTVKYYVLKSAFDNSTFVIEIT